MKPKTQQMVTNITALAKECEQTSLTDFDTLTKILVRVRELKQSDATTFSNVWFNHIDKQLTGKITHKLNVLILYGTKDSGLLRAEDPAVVKAYETYKTKQEQVAMSH